jgi:hypothetical protein
MCQHRDSNGLINNYDDERTDEEVIAELDVPSDYVGAREFPYYGSAREFRIAAGFAGAGVLALIGLAAWL